MITGADVAQALLPLTGEEREKKLFSLAIDKRNYPDFFWQFQPVTVQAQIGNNVRTLVVRVAPDWLCLGTVNDYLRTPQWPAYAAKLAEAFDCVLPTTVLSNAIWDQSIVKGPLQVVPEALPVPSARMETTAAWISSQKLTQQVLGPDYVHYPGPLAAGFKKDLVLGPHLDGQRVAIYGARWPNGVIVQPYSTIHAASYSDYSHGTRLIDANALLDGRTVRLPDLAVDPQLWPLVSNAGPFPLTFPNATATAAAPGATATARVADVSLPPPGIAAFGVNAWYAANDAAISGHPLTENEDGPGAFIGWALGICLTLWGASRHFQKA